MLRKDPSLEVWLELPAFDSRRIVSLIGHGGPSRGKNVCVCDKYKQQLETIEKFTQLRH